MDRHNQALLVVLAMLAGAGLTLLWEFHEVEAHQPTLIVIDGGLDGTSGASGH